MAKMMQNDNLEGEQKELAPLVRERVRLMLPNGAALERVLPRPRRGEAASERGWGARCVEETEVPVGVC